MPFGDEELILIYRSYQQLKIQHYDHRQKTQNEVVEVEEVKVCC